MTTENGPDSRRDWYGFLVLLLAVLGPLQPVGAQPPMKRGLELFSADEAQHLRLSTEEWQQTRRTRSAGVSAGPRIIIRTPQLKEGADGQVIETATPTNLAVQFESNRAPVDMSSLEVKARKSLFSKSLTDLLKPYVRGTELDVKGVAIPAGNFLIEIAIADSAGQTTVQTYRLHVEGQ